MTNHVEHLWNSYVNKCYDGPLPTRQMVETRRAFYGGCLAAWVLMNQAPVPLMRILIKRELDAFRDDVLEGRK